MADRHGPIRTPMGRFVEGVNDGRISQGAVVLAATDLGVETVPVGVLDGAPAAATDLVSVVVPGGARAIKIAGVRPEDTMVLVPGAALGNESLTPVTDGAAGVDRVVDVGEFFPGGSWTASVSDDPGPPRSEWLTARARDEGIELAVEKVERPKRVLVSTGSAGTTEAFGIAEADLPGRPVEDGETFEPTDTLVALTGRAVVEAWPEDGPEVSWPKRYSLDEASLAPAPMGGVTFGVAVLSTPTASVGGESANPLARAKTLDLLQEDTAQRLLAQAGVPETDRIGWLAGPERIRLPDELATAMLLGTETPVESFVGVVGTDAGPWGIGVHVARSDAADNVTVVGIHRRAVGDTERALESLRTGSDTVEGRRLLLETVEALQSG